MGSGGPSCYLGVSHMPWCSGLLYASFMPRYLAHDDQDTSTPQRLHAVLASLLFFSYPALFALGHSANDLHVRGFLTVSDMNRRWRF